MSVCGHVCPYVDLYMWSVCVCVLSLTPGTTCNCDIKAFEIGKWQFLTAQPSIADRRMETGRRAHTNLHPNFFSFNCVAKSSSVIKEFDSLKLSLRKKIISNGSPFGCKINA